LEVAATKKEKARHDAHSCPLGGVVDLIGKKWTLPIINLMGNRQKVRFSEIIQEINAISAKTLSARLKDLVQEGIVRREVIPEMPPHVEYFLTEEGKQLRGALTSLFMWASERRSRESR